jgi:hypothetical protein
MARAPVELMMRDKDMSGIRFLPGVVLEHVAREHGQRVEQLLGLGFDDLEAFACLHPHHPQVGLGELVAVAVSVRLDLHVRGSSVSVTLLVCMSVFTICMYATCENKGT